MNKFFSFLRNHYTDIYKGFLFVAMIVLLVMIFPKEGKFKYEFQKGKPWMHEVLIAPFDFAILKSTEKLEIERKAIRDKIKFYFDFDNNISTQKRQELIVDFNKKWSDKYTDSPDFQYMKEQSEQLCLSIFDSVMNVGIIELTSDIENKPDDFRIIVIRDQHANENELSKLFTIQTAYNFINTSLNLTQRFDNNLLLSVLENSLKQNVVFNDVITESEIANSLNNISLAHGMIQKGERIISKGELITPEKYHVLESLKIMYESQLGSSTTYYAIIAGQIILITIIVFVLFAFLLFFIRDVFNENRKILLVLIQIILMVFITSLVVKYQIDYLYVVPICIIPIILRAFFDTRIALFVHIITIILIGFLVPNSFEFVYLQLIAGVVTIFSIVDLQRRSQFFLTSLSIFVTYILIYIGISLIQEGSLAEIKLMYFALFAGSALLSLFSYPMIFIFEKVFGLITDVTLMELSNTNTKLLRELSMKAPGTFQHSLQVSNLAEEAIYEIGGNNLLVRTGALYHDIGKMDNPLYFVENQTTGINPHDELTNEESARIIIGHVIKGIEKAKKNKLPEQIIDFIRTHHGTRKAQYFYALEKNNTIEGEIIDESIFTYHGPIPFSKETSVLMMADSVEAASRSLKTHDEEKINSLVDKIIDAQLYDGQFANSDITMKEIEKIKKIFKKMLLNIYHVRIEYPE
ncbi:MAG: HDIG domain-containing protein [Bacteroidales bacterium]|nr:HDIG domain-containing protein [Bacteroidales bacterium]